jgi:mannose-1-phosphate guanylyltransferase
MRLVHLDRNAVVAFFPSDHHVADEETFRAEVLFAFEKAERVSGIILLGATARAPEVEYGWIEPEFQAGEKKLLKVRRFWENHRAKLRRSCSVEAVSGTRLSWSGGPPPAWN